MENSLSFHSSQFRGTPSEEETFGLPIPLGIRIHLLIKKKTSWLFYSSLFWSTLSEEEIFGLPISLGLGVLHLKKKLSYLSNSLTFYSLSWYLITTNVEYTENFIGSEKCNSVYFKTYPICFIENYQLNGVKRKAFCLELKPNRILYQFWFKMLS